MSTRCEECKKESEAVNMIGVNDDVIDICYCEDCDLMFGKERKE